MRELEDLQRRLRNAERRIHGLAAVVVVLAGTLLMGAIRPDSDVIRARGLVITDEAGRERIVIGAPMRNASEDPKLALTTGLAVLDSAGNLHVAVGTNSPLVVAPGVMGQRIAEVAGLTVYDPRDGRERGGIGAFADGRANVCLDYGARSKEAVCMSVAPGDQYAAVLINGTPGEEVFDRVVMFAGADGSGSIKVFGGRENRGGVMLRAGSGAPSITMYDSTGAAMPNPGPR
jgi:hypothetical protein